MMLLGSKVVISYSLLRKEEIPQRFSLKFCHVDYKNPFQMDVRNLQPNYFTATPVQSSRSPPECLEEYDLISVWALTMHAYLQSSPLLTFPFILMTVTQEINNKSESISIMSNI